MRVLRNIALLLAVFISSLAFSQNRDSVALRAKIIDSKTRQPVPFATVKLMKDNVFLRGVISNAEGDFQIPAWYVPRIDSITITSIGYNTLGVKARLLDRQKINTLFLIATPLRLKEVIITAHQPRLTAKKIVKFAIQNIPVNNPTHPFSYLAYYRDYQKEANEYVNLNEGVIKVFDEGFSSNDYDDTKIKLYQYRTNKDFKTDSLTSRLYDNNSKGGSKYIPSAVVGSFGGNELSILRIHDAIRNYEETTYSFVDKFSDNFADNHSFRLLETVYQDNIPLYHISFESYYFVAGSSHIARGDIYIEHGNYAIHRLDYSNYLKDYRRETLLYNIRVEYTRSNSLMYLNYISFNNIFKSKSIEEFKAVDLIYDRGMNAFVVTFNRPPEKTSALNKKNYSLKFDNIPFVFEKIAFQEKNDRIVNLSVKNADEFNLKRSPADLVRHFEVSLKNITDTAGNEINQLKYKLVNQYRELFMQSVDSTPAASSTGKFINKIKPLTTASIDSTGVPSDNWMNTPLSDNPDWSRENLEHLVSQTTVLEPELMPGPRPADSVSRLTVPGFQDISFLQEKPYLHIDKPYYYPGEKIWFKAYMNYRDPDARDTLSQVLYVDLVHSSGKIERSCIVRIEDGMAAGEISLPSHLMPGSYFIRAYTQWMLNYSLDNVFVKALPVLGLFDVPDPMVPDTVDQAVYPGLVVSADKQRYKLREAVTLNITLMDSHGNPVQGNLSVSVTDTKQVIEIPNEGNIIDNYPFKVFSNATRADSLILPIEFGISLKGRYSPRKEKSFKKKLMVVQIQDNKLGDFVAVDTDAAGNFWVTGLYVYDSAEVGIKVDGEKPRKNVFAVIPRQLPQTKEMIPTEVLKTKQTSTSQRPELRENVAGDAILLKELVVKESKYVERPSDPYYGTPDFSVSEQNILKYNSVLMALTSSVPGFPAEPLVVIDGVRVSGESARTTLTNLNPSSVRRVDVLKYGGSAIYGSAGANGVVIVHTKAAEYSAEKKNSKSIDLDAFQLFKIAGFTAGEQFLAPDYSIPGDPQKRDLRSTIFWQPIVKLDEQSGKGTVTFYTADAPATYRVVVEGISTGFQPVRRVVYVEVTR